MMTPRLFILVFLLALRFQQCDAFAFSPWSKRVDKVQPQTVHGEYELLLKASDVNEPRTPGKDLTFKSEKTTLPKERASPTVDKFINVKNGQSCRIYYESKTIKVADCAYSNLETVPQNLPRDIAGLILTDNRITSDSLKNGPFRIYDQLMLLFINNNDITSLPDHSFAGLSKLIHLNLHNNSIVMNSALNQSTAFAPLKDSLLTLVFNNNTKDTNAPGLDYPDKALSFLTHLQTLEIDGIPNKTFGYHFQFMGNLTNLSLEGYFTGKCNLSLLKNDTFEYVPNIRNLNISDCKIRKYLVGADVLAPLGKLEVLDISYNFDLGFDGLGKLMYGQRDNKNLRHISLQYIVQRYEPCIVLYKDMLENFRNLSLESIDATRNNIEMIEYGAIDYLPRTIKVINLSRNIIMFGAYWEHLKDMTNLEYLNLDGYNQAYRLPLRPPPKNIHCPQHSEGQGKHNIDKEAIRTRKEIGPLTLELPPKLKIITMSSYSLSYKIDTIVFGPNNTLRSVILNRNYLPKLNGPVYGLDHLEYLDISSCSVDEISSNFISSFKSLKRVNLNKNFLGDSLFEQSSIFASKSLEELNIGFNNIFTLNEGVFKYCPNLKTLILSGNRITRLDSTLDHLPRLSILYLTRNSLNSIPKTLRGHFDRIEGRKFIDMTFNPIACNCDNIDFLDWVTRTGIFGNDYKNYYCSSPDDPYNAGSHMNNGYDEELKLLINQCANNTKLFICVISASVAFFLVLIGVIGYRFRWSMRYWYYVAKVMLTYKKNKDSVIEYEYDLFVCYCHQDNKFITEELEPRLGQERGIKLLLHDKCFQAGQEIAESILKAVQRSSKTLVVMSKSMMDSNWCNYEMAMAKQESISTGRNVLVILFLEKIPQATMSLDMVNYIRSNVIVTYPASHPEVQEEFWDRLASDLQS